MKLPLRDRVRLAQRLVSNLDDPMEADVESLWAAEAERRREELRTGKVQGIEAAEAFRKARQEFAGELGTTNLSRSTSLTALSLSKGG